MFVLCVEIYISDINLYREKFISLYPLNFTIKYTPGQLESKDL